MRENKKVFTPAKENGIEWKPRIKILKSDVFFKNCGMNARKKKQQKIKSDKGIEREKKSKRGKIGTNVIIEFQ